MKYCVTLGLAQAAGIAGLFTLALPGCQDYLFEQKCPAAITEATQSVAAAQATPADILFIVDNSGSMADDQDNLAENFDKFIDVVAGAGDYRIAIVTTDQTSANEEQGLQGFGFTTEFPFHLESNRRNDCSPLDGTGGRPLIPRSCFRGPTTRVITSLMSPQAQRDTFAENVRVGSCGIGTPEQGLKAMMTALDQTSAGECNTDFLRPGANLIIVFVSDEEDGSCDGTDCKNVGSPGTPPSAIVDFVNGISAFKAYSQIRVAAIVGVDGEGSPSDCNFGSVTTGTECGSPTVCASEPTPSRMSCTADSSVCPEGEECLDDESTSDPADKVCLSTFIGTWNDVTCKWCSWYNTPDCCSALSGSRYVQFALDMEAKINEANQGIPVTNCQGGGDAPPACLIDSICQENFGDTLARIARELVLTNQYTLVDPAVSGVAVKITNSAGNVEELAQDQFTLSDDKRIVTIIGDAVPKEGDQVDVFYISNEDAQGEPRGACVP